MFSKIITYTNWVYLIFVFYKMVLNPIFQTLEFHII